MNSFLGEKIVNTGRQKELYLAKAFAIFLMIVCHTGLYFFEYGGTDYLISDVIGSEFVAPVFMVCLGIGTVYSKHNTPKELFIRGLKTLFFGYLLNFCREGIPCILGQLTGHPFSFGIFEAMIAVDILQFAGMAFMTLALLKKLKLGAAQQFMIGLLCAGLGEVLAWQSLGNSLLDAFCGLIWGTNEDSYFTLLNWITFPTAGVLFGNILQHCTDKTKLYKSIFPIGLAGVALAYYQLFTDHEAYYNNGCYYYMGIKNVVFALFFPIVMFSVCQFLSNKTKLADNPVVVFGSKNLIRIYCISWVLIVWTRWILINLLGFEFSRVLVILMMLLMLALSFAVAKLYINLKQRLKKS